jgi:hypothetical protein
MTNRLVQSYGGPFIINLQQHTGVLVDAADGDTQGCRQQQPGFEGVSEELLQALPLHGATIGLSNEVLARFQLLNERITAIRASRHDVDKAAEVLAETEILLEDQREAEIGVIVDAVRSAARRKDPSLLAPFEQTLRYNAQIGVRAAKTRKKNAQQAAAAAAAAEAEAEAEVEAEAPPSEAQPE